MSRQCEAANLRRAPIEHMKQHPLSQLPADWFSVTEHATVDCEIAITDLVSVRHPLRERRFHGRFPRILQGLNLACGREKVHRHVATLTERRFEFFEYEKDFPLVAPRLMLGLYVNRSDLTAVLSSVEISTRPIMRVIETEAGWTRSEHNPAHSACWDERRPFFRSAIHIRRNKLSVPVQLLRGLRVVVHLNRHRLAFLEPQQGSGELPVVGDRREDAFRRNLDRTRADAQGIARRACFRLWRNPCGASRHERHRVEPNSGTEHRSSCSRSCHLKKLPTRRRVFTHELPPGASRRIRSKGLMDSP